MSSDIVLSNALRTNLASLSNTQSLIDSTQARLSSGKKVNSALDNPLSFFSAQALSNRSSALSNLLDGIGQSIQTIQAANTGVTSLTSLVNQAQSVATQAQDVSSSATSTAVIAGDTSVSTLDLSSNSAFAASKLNLTFTDKNNHAITLATAAAHVTNTSNQAAIDTGSSGVQKIADIVNTINAIKDSTGNQLVKASLNASGDLQLTSLQGTNINVGFTGSTSSASTATSQALASTFGFSTVAHALSAGGSSATDAGFTIKASPTISSASLYTSTAGSFADRTTQLANLKASDGSTALTTISKGAGAGSALSFNVGINGSLTRNIALTATSTIQDLVDGINNDSVLSTKVQASFDETTGSISLKGIDSSVQSIDLSTTAVGGTATTSQLDLNLGFGTKALTTGLTASGGTKNSDVDSIRSGAAAGDTSSYEANFNKLLDQITSLVKDSGYQGTNLLNSNDLTTVFNEDRSNTLTTSGGDFTSTGLGLKSADFSSADTIKAALTSITKALTTIQNFGSSLSTDLSVLQTRQGFTKSLTSVLDTGASNLTTADTNEESANLLALQTRQSLGVDALSLASQSQQSVLKLFG